MLVPNELYDVPNGIPSNQGHVICNLQILPSSFDNVAYLDYSNYLHLFGKFYVDINHLEHVISFQINTPSAFRIVAENNNFIHVTTYLAVFDYIGDMMISSEKKNQVSSIYQYLDEGSYQIYFEFSPQSTTTQSDCSYVQLEVEIIPTSSIPNFQCTTSNPLSEYDQPYSVEYPINFSSKSQYTVASSESNKYFWSFQISVGDFPTHVKPVITVELEYEFSVGKLMAILERKTNNHCNSSNALISSNCIAGQSFYNHHELQAVVDDNENYVLWLYLPNSLLPTITSCFNYSLSISITSTVLHEDYWNCEASRPPEDLSSSEYMDSNGRVHFVDQFFIPSSDYTISMEISQTSYFRMFIESPYPISIHYRKENATTFTDYTYSSDYLSSSVILEPNTYYITINTWAVTSGDGDSFCETSSFEVAIEPVELYQDLTCSSLTENLPDINQFQGISAPFRLEAPTEFVPPQLYTAYYANHDDNLIFSFPLELSEDTETIIQIESLFLLNNVYVVVEDLLEENSVRSSSFYNSQFLRVKLGQGNYNVNVLFDNQNFGEYNFDCADFTFQLILSEISPCTDVVGQILPTSLNSIRFLGKSNEMSYNYQYFLPPPDFYQTKNSFSTTSFSVDEVSILRMYLNPSTDLYVSIQIVYFDYNIQEEVQVYETNPDLIAKTQSFVITVQPDYMYYIRMTYTEKPGKHKDCPTFQMQIGIGPVNPLPLVCPSADNLPTYFPSYLPQTAYHYDSQTANETFYFQQEEGKSYTTYLPFKFYAYGDIHLEVTYDFLTSDLYVRIDDIVLNSVYHATKTDGRTVIHLVGVPPGTYAVLIAQIPNEISILGCSYFTYKITIEQYTTLKMNLLPFEYLPLPSSFNSIGYLDFDKSIQFNEEVYLTENHNYIHMNITVNSYLRFTIQNQQRIDASVRITMDDNTILFGLNDGQLNLTPGNYVIDIQPTILSVAFRIQIEVNPQDEVNSYLAARNYEYPGCPPKPPPIIPTIKPNTTYTFSSTSMTISRDNTLVSSIILEAESYVLIHSGFQYLPDLISFTLESNNITVYSYSYQLNEAELYSFVPAGTYKLRIFIDQFASIAHCSVYSLLIAISDQPQHVECYRIASLPYNLNDQTGGSSLYGGPIDTDGNLSFLGPAFTIFSLIDHTSIMEISLENPSMVAIFTSSADATIQYQITTLDQSIVTPIYTYVSSNFVQKVFDLIKSNYTLQIFDFSTRAPECATYSMSIDITPSSSITNPPNCFQPSLPVSDLSVVNGYANDWKEAFLPVYLFNQTFTTQFSITSPSTLHCILSFDIFKSTGRFSLSRNGKKIATTTTYSSSSFSTVTNVITELTQTINQGDYSLELTFDEYQYTNGESFGCFPYTWNLQITPYSDNPSVLSVNPSNSNYVLPFATITLDIAFSSPLYSNGSILSGVNKQPIIDAMYLGVMDNSNAMDQYPSKATNLDLLAMFWRLEFTGRFLVPGESYLLSINEGILTDFDEVVVILQTVNIYRMLPQCSEYEHYNVSSFKCVCNEGYQGENCDECAEGYMGYPVCSPLDYCHPVCVNGECEMQVCNCTMGWAGAACNYCDDHFTGNNCDQCDEGWDGPSCSVCAPHYTGDNCDQCVDHFTGDNCDECEVGWAGDNCDYCDDHFTGENCDQCTIGWSGTTCSTCDPRFTGPNCDVCLYPFTGAQCDQCADHFDGFNCSECKMGWSGLDCNSCALHYTGGECDHCDIGWSDPMNNCDECSERFLEPDCVDCKYPFTGPNCTQCQGNFVGIECSYCKLGWAGDNCDQCDDHFIGENCNECDVGWQGPSCDYCDDRHQGPNCDECVNQWNGDLCEVCPSNYQINPGDCSICASNYQGENCEECTADWTGDDCSIPANVLTEGTHVIEYSTHIDNQTPIKNKNIVMNVRFYFLINYLFLFNLFNLLMLEKLDNYYFGDYHRDRLFSCRIFYLHPQKTKINFCQGI